MQKIILIILFLLISNQAKAYLGPGIAGGILTASIGIVVGILVLIFGILWFPIKRFFRKKKDIKIQKNQDTENKDVKIQNNQETENNE